MPQSLDQRHDHDRDIRKAEWRPGDPDPLPVRFAPPIAGALEVAILVKGLTDYTAAAGLIEQYAQTVAAEARLQAVIDTSDKILAQIGGTNA